MQPWQQNMEIKMLLEESHLLGCDGVFSGRNFQYFGGTSRPHLWGRKINKKKRRGETSRKLRLCLFIVAFFVFFYTPASHARR
jgi:hypothetical protein